jgi:hypothetical protein
MGCCGFADAVRYVRYRRAQDNPGKSPEAANDSPQNKPAGRRRAVAAPHVPIGAGRRLGY